MRFEYWFGTLTSAEREELSQLSDKVEEYAVQRLKHIIQLAKLRNTSVEKVLEEFAHLTYHHAAWKFSKSNQLPICRLSEA